MTDTSNQILPKKIPWNKSRFTGAKPPLKPKQIWGIRARLQIAKRTRDLALVDLVLDSKLRGCDLVRLKSSDIALHGAVQTRATVTQRKTGRPVHFELTEQTQSSFTLGCTSAAITFPNISFRVGLILLGTSARANTQGS